MTRSLDNKLFKKINCKRLIHIQTSMDVEIYLDIAEVLTINQKVDILL